MDADVYLNGKKCDKVSFGSEKEFEEIIRDNSSNLFGDKTVYLEAKKKVDSKTLGGTIPDGYLFDLSDIENPQFYLVEVELQKHDFFSHIFPQITKFLNALNKDKSKRKLVNKLYKHIKEDEELLNNFNRLLGDKELYKSIQDAVVNSQDILLILNGRKEELTEVKETYENTWGKIVKALIVSIFNKDNNTIISVEPKFEKIGLVDIVETEEEKEVNEEYHLEDIEEETKEIYIGLKENVLEYNEDLVFNPQKYYISIRDTKNFAYIQIRKTKIQITLMLPIEKGKEIIRNHNITELSESVQNYYNGECFKVTLEDIDNLEEVIEAVKKAHRRSL